MLEAWCQDLAKGLFAYQIWQDFDEGKLRTFKWWCCPEKHGEVVPYRRHLREGIWVCSHFKLKPEGNCPVGESALHRNRKILLAELLEAGRIIIQDGAGLVVDLARQNFTEVPELEFRWGTPSRRTDVCLPFKVFHPYLGQGIAFEILVSTKEEKERTNDWLERGFSLAWLDENDFTGEHSLKLPILIEHPWIERLRFMDIIVFQKEKYLDEEIVEVNAEWVKVQAIRHKMESELANVCAFYEKFPQIEGWLAQNSCSSCHYMRKDNWNSNQLLCWYWYWKARKSNGQPIKVKGLGICQYYQPKVIPKAIAPPVSKSIEKKAI